MLALAADLDPFAAGADEILQGRVQVQRIAHLIEVGHLQVRALPHRATVGRKFAKDQLEQRCLARAIRADEPKDRALRDVERDIADRMDPAEIA